MQFTYKRFPCTTSLMAQAFCLSRVLFTYVLSVYDVSEMNSFGSSVRSDHENHDRCRHSDTKKKCYVRIHVNLDRGHLSGL